MKEKNDEGVPSAISARGKTPRMRKSSRPPRTEDAATAWSEVSSTLRIPLAARALGDALFPQMAVGDAYAGTMLAALGDDGAQWLHDLHGIYGCLARTKRFRALAADFLAQYPSAYIANLGCGFSHYFQWLDNGMAHMVDADLPPVLAMRRQLLPIKNPRHTLREMDLSDDGWWDALGLPSGADAEPVFLFSEGVMMYLTPGTVGGILKTIGERAPAGSVFAFDAFCCFIVGQAWLHQSVKQTAAEFLWGPHSIAELRHPHPRLRLRATHAVMESYGFPYVPAWTMFQTLMGVPMYAIYELRAGDAPRRASRSSAH